MLSHLCLHRLSVERRWKMFWFSFYHFSVVKVERRFIKGANGKWNEGDGIWIKYFIQPTTWIDNLTYNSTGKAFSLPRISHNCENLSFSIKRNFHLTLDSVSLLLNESHPEKKKQEEKESEKFSHTRLETHNECLSGGCRMKLVKNEKENTRKKKYRDDEACAAFFSSVFCVCSIEKGRKKTRTKRRKLFIGSWKRKIYIAFQFSVKINF